MIQSVSADLPADLAPSDTGGTPVHTTPHARIDHLIGYFTKALVAMHRTVCSSTCQGKPTWSFPEKASEYYLGSARVGRMTLDALQHAGIIEKRAIGNGRGYDYCLTAAGREFGPLIEALGTWGYSGARGIFAMNKLTPTMPCGFCAGSYASRTCRFFEWSFVSAFARA